MVDTRSGKSTSRYTLAQQEQMAALVRENREKKELLKQVKLKAIAGEQAAKMKKLEEKMVRVQQEMEERRKAAEEEAAAETEEERLEKRRREERGESSGTTEEDAKMEKNICEWVANLSWGEDEEAQLYVLQEEKEVFAKALEMIDDPLEHHETEDEKKLEWKRRMKREKKRRREEAARLAAEVEKARGCRQELQAQAEVPAKLDKIVGYLKVLSEAWLEERQSNRGHDVALQAMRAGFREFARDVVTHVGTEVKGLKEGMRKFCEGAIEGAKVVATAENPSLPFVVTTNASRYGIGAVLQQDDDNGYKPIEFMSAWMPSEKVATSTYERELYALRQALEHWKHYLLGRHFKVYSDHETLRWLKTQAKMTPKLTRWAAEIDQYDFELKPVKGKYNVVADALSRRSDYFGAIVHCLDIGSDLQEKVRQAYAHDPIYSDLLKRVKEAPRTEPDYRTTRVLLFEKTNVVDCLCIPNSEEIHSLILEECHDTEGHFGWQKTLANLMHAYTWSRMKNDCIEYVHSCKVRSGPPAISAPTSDRRRVKTGKYGVTLPRIRGEGGVTTEFFEIYEQETVVRFSVASDENDCTRKAEIFLSPDAQLVFATELAEGKDPLGIAEKTLKRVQRLRRVGTGGPVFDKVEYRGREEVPRAGHGRIWSIPTWAYRLLYKDDETARKVRLRSQVIEKFPLGEEGGHELFTQCWESREDTDFEWWARVGEFIKPLFSGQPGDVDRDLIRRCAQEGVRGILDLEVANLALAASEEKKLRDSWWTVTSEESEGEGADEDSSEEKEGTEEEKSSGSNRDSGEEGEPGSDTDGSERGH
ncbi:hypothetical protein CBR_g12429 [Chara braunii]|uniref:Reverse transcriptase RNase H-like domain-containing protein n=1 Tax=Chara braunii TaxID=69332 RepID=A0A388JSF0_CHABU|nr:hypothetical protein CBR_g12429 [Chara braunii]|eukprot:GBG60693.1 hypothetical protein CBR_g12429 [Chara braunii]